MAKDADPDTGVSPKAKDGEPNGKTEDEKAMQREHDELAMHRARAREGIAVDDKGKPIDGQPDEPEPELFPQGSIPGDHKVTMKNIVPGGKARKTESKMGAAAVPLLAGLVHYGELVELLVTVEAGKVEEVPDLEEPESGGRRRLLGVKDVQHFRPVHVRSAEGVLTIGQVVDLLEERFGIPRSSDKIMEVFGPQTPEQHAKAAKAAG